MVLSEAFKKEVRSGMNEYFPYFTGKELRLEGFFRSLINMLKKDW